MSSPGPKLILGVESSCDETSISVLKEGKIVLSNIVFSQIKRHKKYGGVVPEYASRMHAETIQLVYEKALAEAGIKSSELDAIAVTYGPGLEGSLLVGAAFAKSIGLALNIPVIPVNHMHGHIYANFLMAPQPQFPFICMVVSGGHTNLLLVEDHFKFNSLGQTRDDAAGEAFDKVARCIGLTYPGGPNIEREAKEGNPKAFNFPRAMKHQGYEFSFSGLKTAVVQQVAKLKKELGDELPVQDLAASFQAAVFEVLIYKSLKACNEHGISQLSVTGGVSANRSLKAAFEKAAQEKNITLHVPELQFCTDNAAMIAVAGYYKKTMFPKAASPFKVASSLSILTP